MLLLGSAGCLLVACTALCFCLAPDNVSATFQYRYASLSQGTTPRRVDLQPTIQAPWSLMYPGLACHHQEQVANDSRSCPGLALRMAPASRAFLPLACMARRKKKSDGLALSIHSDARLALAWGSREKVCCVHVQDAGTMEEQSRGHRARHRAATLVPSEVK